MVLSTEEIKNIKQMLASLPESERQVKINKIISKLSPEELKQLQGGGQQCAFCLMVEGKIGVKKVYEDEKCVAVLDIHPATKGHVILIPKEHHELLTQMEEKETQQVFLVANKLSEILIETLNAQGINIFAANGPAAGQKAPHAFISLIPRFENDGVSFNLNQKEVTEEELTETQNTINKKPLWINKKEEVEVIKKPSLDEGMNEFFRRFRRIP